MKTLILQRIDAEKETQHKAGQQRKGTNHTCISMGYYDYCIVPLYEYVSVTKEPSFQWTSCVNFFIYLFFFFIPWSPHKKNLEGGVIFSRNWVVSSLPDQHRVLLQEVVSSRRSTQEHCRRDLRTKNPSKQKHH